MILRKSILALAFASSCALAALPSTMLFQGQMPGVSGNKDVSVKLYDAMSDGSLVWVENLSGVAFNDGYFALQLGASQALPEFDAPLYMALVVDGVASSARIPLTVAPYAKRAAVADSAVHSFRAVSAQLADVATNADNAAMATEARRAALADSSGKADFANSVTTWNEGNTIYGFGGYTRVLNGLTHLSSVVVPSDKEYMILRTYAGSGSAYGVAGLYLDPSNYAARLFVGRGPGMPANHGSDSLTMTPDSLYSSVDMKFVDGSTLDLPMVYTGNTEGDPASAPAGNADYPSSPSVACSEAAHLGRLAAAYYTDNVNEYQLYLCGKNTRGSYYWQKMATAP